MQEWGIPTWWLLVVAIGLVGVFCLRWWLLYYRKKELARMVDKRLEETAGVPRSPFLYHLKTVFLLLAWVLMAYAWLDPYSGSYRLSSPQVGIDMPQGMPENAMEEIILAVDVSASMGVKDMWKRETRLEAAKEIVELMVEKASGQHIALYAFTAEPVPLVPPTLDYLFMLLMLRHMQINEGGGSGTDFTAVVERIASEAQDRHPGIKRSLVILSDGEDQGLVDKGAGEEQAKLMGIVDKLASQGWHFFTVGLGTTEGGEVPKVTYEGKPVRSGLEAGLLRRLAERGKGAYWEAGDSRPMVVAEQLLAAIEAKQGDLTAAARVSSSSPLQPSQGYFQLPLAVALMLLLGVLLLPDVAPSRRM